MTVESTVTLPAAMARLTDAEATADPETSPSDLALATRRGT
ncbi:MAG TPA: hypothetical protein VMC83_34330 [Streptosporangiaceae bacterium]|nr:hypothetical protein [Streptosporangiaceae bacterium]